MHFGSVIFILALILSKLFKFGYTLECWVCEDPKCESYSRTECTPKLGEATMKFLNVQAHEWTVTGSKTFCIIARQHPITTLKKFYRGCYIGGADDCGLYEPEAEDGHIHCTLCKKDACNGNSSKVLNAILRNCILILCLNCCLWKSRLS